MIHVREATIERAIRALHACGTLEATRIATELLVAGVESVTQQINFNEVPALCRAQAG